MLPLPNTRDTSLPVAPGSRRAHHTNMPLNDLVADLLRVADIRPFLFVTRPSGPTRVNLHWLASGSGFEGGTFTNVSSGHGDRAGPTPTPRARPLSPSPERLALGSRRRLRRPRLKDEASEALSDPGFSPSLYGIPVCIPPGKTTAEAPLQVDYLRLAILRGTRFAMRSRVTRKTPTAAGRAQLKDDAASGVPGAGPRLRPSLRLRPERYIILPQYGHEPGNRISRLASDCRPDIPRSEKNFFHGVTDTFNGSEGRVHCIGGASRLPIRLCDTHL